MMFGSFGFWTFVLVSACDELSRGDFRASDCKVKARFKMQTGGIHLVQTDPGQQPGSFGAASDTGEHLRLQVHGRHVPGGSDYSGQGNREVADPTPEVQARFPGVNEILENPLRLLDETPHEVVKGV
jgi:hypothetical protein